MKLSLEEKKLANEEHQRLVEEERKLFCIDTFNMDESQKGYTNLLVMMCWLKEE
jgi:hypothetical protein